MKKIIIFYIILIASLQMNAQDLRNPLYTTTDDQGLNGLNGMNSDWGPRNYDGGSQFHAGLDLRVLPARAGREAYAIQCPQGNQLTFHPTTNIENCYIRIGSWAYMHCMTGDHFNSTPSYHWVLNTTVDTKTHILLETEDEDGNTKIFVDDDDFMTVPRTSQWDDEDGAVLPTQTAELGDIVFRTRVNHCHLYNISNDNWINPLAFIDYDGSATNNNMTLNLRMKYNNGTSAVVIPKYNNHDVVYGNEVIVESDVDYQNDLDLNITEVGYTPEGGSYSELFYWMYSNVLYRNPDHSRKRHVTFTDRYDGISAALTSYYNIHRLNSITDIRSDIREGMFPVDTEQEDNLGQDILKRYWNSQENWNTDSPKYPDGRYNFQLRTYDIRGNVSTNPAQVNDVIIDNFKPYVKKIVVRKGSAFGEISSGIVYEGEWRWNSTGSQLELVPKDYGCDISFPVYIHIFTSEPMQCVDMLLNNNLCTFVNSVDNDKEWIFEVAPENLRSVNQIIVSSSSTDLADNGLYGLRVGTNMVLRDAFPIHNNLVDWSGYSVQDDNVHLFSAAIKYYSSCYKYALDDIDVRALKNADGVVTHVSIAWTPFDNADVVYNVYKSDNVDMTYPTPLPNIPISGGMCIDRDPWKGKTTYYSVVAMESLKSAALNCPESPIAKIYIDEDGSEGSEDPYVEGNSYNCNKQDEYCFSLSYYNGYDPSSDVTTINFGDGSDDGVYNGQVLSVTHEYSNNFFGKKTYYPKATVIHGGETFEIPFEEVTIYAPDRPLTVSISTDKVSVLPNYPIELTAQAETVIPGSWGVNWKWTINKNVNDMSESSDNVVTISNHTDEGSNTTGKSSNTITYSGFSTPGQYLVQVNITDIDNGKIARAKEIITVDENCVSSNVYPLFEDEAELPNDCYDHNLNSEFVYKLPEDLIVGNCDGTDYYLYQVKIYVNGYFLRTIDCYNYFDYGGLFPIINKNHDYYYHMKDDLSVDFNDFSFHHFPASKDFFSNIMYEVIGRIYQGGVSEGEGHWCTLDECTKSDIELRLVGYANCSESFICDNKTLLDYEFKYYKTSSESKRGYSTFRGNGGVIKDKSDFGVVARNEITFEPGVLISNSNFIASIEPCDYSLCDNGLSGFSELSSESLKSKSIVDSTLGVSSLVLKDISVYPNPVCQMLNINSDIISENATSNVVIYNMSGQIMKSILSKGNNFTVQVSDLRPGMYIISVNSSEKIYNCKFIKE